MKDLLKLKHLKMKNINTYMHFSGHKLKVCVSCLLLSLLIFASCEDILEEKPKTLAVEVFYNTPEEVETAVNAIYTPIRGNIVEQTVILDTHTDWGY